MNDTQKLKIFESYQTKESNEKTDFMKYPKIKIIGDEENKDLLTNPDDEIVIEEKIDGGNFRFMVTDGRYIFGSRTQELGEDKQEEKAWARCIGYIKRLMKHGDYNHYIFYGECCIRHSTPYDFDKIPPFLGFDIYDLRTHRFLSYIDAKNMYESVNLYFVPVIGTVKAGELKQYADSDVPKSMYYDGQAEGVVFKNYTTQVFAKYVTLSHREIATKVFGGSKKWATNDTDRILAMYCTNPRIDKKVYELIHEGNKLEMTLMKQLPTRVFLDICDEHYHDILSRNNKIDVGELRKGIAKRCLHVLTQMITNSSFYEHSSLQDDKVISK